MSHHCLTMGISLINDWVVLDSMRKQAEQAMRNKRVSIILRHVYFGIQSFLFFSSSSSFFFFFFFWFSETGFLCVVCRPGCPRTQSVDQGGLELRNLPASASQVLGLKARATKHTILSIQVP
jgi:hypothetical protein